MRRGFLPPGEVPGEAAAGPDGAAAPGAGSSAAPAAAFAPSSTPEQSTPEPAASPDTPPPEESAAEPASAASVDGGLELSFRASPVLHDGRFASNPWLLELPQPLTKLSWADAVILSPRTARRLGLVTDALVEVRVGTASVTGAALVLPGHADGVLSLSLGWGRRDGRRAGDRERLRRLPRALHRRAGAAGHGAAGGLARRRAGGAPSGDLAAVLGSAQAADRARGDARATSSTIRTSSSRTTASSRRSTPGRRSTPPSSGR